MKLTRYLVPSLLAGSLLAGGASSSFAAQKKVATPRAFAYGQVSNLTTTGFTLTRTPKKAGATSKVVQVALSSTSKEQARKGTTGALTSGEYAFVVGAKGATGVAANRVLYSTTAFNARRLIQRIRTQRLANRIAHRLLRPHLAAGLVNGATTTSTSISITTAKGKTLVFAITPQTKYRVNKALTTTAPTFTNGEKVRVRFARAAATKALTVRLIAVVPAA
ncbi:MAG: hypothetical protein M3Z66_15980 [Chloroflexota bacterium]|nr:hypothetical protein [Chloroflexota bacterium]